jgi:signal transduction histidine kinase
VLFDGAAVCARAVATSDPALEEATGRAMVALDPSAPPGVGLAQSRRGTLDMDRPQLVRHVDDGALRTLAADDGQVETLRAARLRSLIRVPLLTRDRVLGVITLGRTHDTPFDEKDLAFAEDLGWRAALAIDNARLYKHAVEALTLRDEFLSIASHELNTPLTPLKLQLDALRRGDFPPERLRERLDSASRQVSRLTRLVTDLLEISRFSEGKIRLVRETFDLAALVDTVVERMTDDALRAGSRVEVTAQRPCTGVWDRARIDQVLTNLLSNALKFGAGQPVDVDVSCGETFARLCVRDRGIGIARESQAQIFARFERASSPRHYGGLGFGLWIAQQIVDASGGSITVQSEPQEGATFVVELPRNLPRS